ncbi:MAG: hypothetical protein ACU0DW_16040 [Shimia sp.]
MDRSALEQRWLRLTREELPALADQRRWPIRFDHCFQRVFLDAACGGVWYDHIPERPAYAKAPELILREAIRLAEAVAAGTRDLRPLNDQSIAWRRARKAAP